MAKDSYYLRNKEKCQERRKEKREKKSKEELKKIAHEAYLRRRDKAIVSNREYSKEHSEKYSKYQAEYRENNRDKNKAYQKEWYRDNKEWHLEYYREKRKNSSLFRVLQSLRSRQGRVLKGITSTTKGLGCNKDFLRSYIESKWIEGMSWSNYGFGKGKWVIDHILPLVSCDKREDGSWDPESEYNKQLIHYSNLQPLWFEDNAYKSGKIVVS